MRHFKFAKVALMTMMATSLPSHAAVYSISEINTAEIARHAFPSAINNVGDVTIAVNSPVSVSDTVTLTIPEYNIPIDISSFDFDAEGVSDSLTDVESARNGDFNLEDYETLIRVIISLQGTNTSQRIVSFQSYKTENGVTEFLPGFDEVDADFDGYTKGVETRVQDIDNNGNTVGISQGKPTKVDFVTEAGDEITFVLREFLGRGFVDINGAIVGLESESNLVGGYTEAYDINNNLMVAGLEIKDPTDNFVEAVEACDDEEQRGEQPVELCRSTLHNSMLVSHERRGVLWQLDNAGNVIDKISLGIPFEPETDDLRLYTSTALAVNDNGVAVGSASDFFEDNRDFSARIYPVAFNGDEVVSFLDRNEYIGGEASDINNSNIAVGNGQLFINGVQRTKFFTYDVDSGELTFPEDFFPGSGSVANAINDSGIVVGEGEIETSITSTRRRHAFVYDTNDNTFQNLNDLVACNSPYTIVQANDINDSGQIAALALVNRAQRDAQGNPVLEEDGTASTEDALVTVVLNPVPGGEVDSCDTPTTPGEEVQERSGGSLGFVFLTVLGFLGLRRSRK